MAVARRQCLPTHLRGHSLPPFIWPSPIAQHCTRTWRAIGAGVCLWPDADVSGVPATVGEGRVCLSRSRRLQPLIPRLAASQVLVAPAILRLAQEPDSTHRMGLHGAPHRVRCGAAVRSGGVALTSLRALPTRSYVPMLMWGTAFTFLPRCAAVLDCVHRAATGCRIVSTALHTWPASPRRLSSALPCPLPMQEGPADHRGRQAHPCAPADVTHAGAGTPPPGHISARADARALAGHTAPSAPPLPTAAALRCASLPCLRKGASSERSNTCS